MKMIVKEYGKKENPRFLLITTAAMEPWNAFEPAILYLAKAYHVYAVAADGHDRLPGDFESVEKTARQMQMYFKARGITSFYGAYGLSMGGAILLRFLTTAGIRVKKAVLDGAILPYTYPKWLCKMIWVKDYLTMKAVARNHTLLESIVPREEGTPKGMDPDEVYEDLYAFYDNSYSDTSIKNDFWSANNYDLPMPPPLMDTEFIYWAGEKEIGARRNDLKFLKQYLPGVQYVKMKGVGHGELVMFKPERWIIAAKHFFGK